jgi:alcohol dehydrogenase class IV
MPATFTHQALAARILFGAGRRAELGAELAALKSQRPLILCTSSQRAEAARLAAACGGVVFAGAAMHTPVEVTETALADLHAQNCDGLVALDGGSSWGFPKPWPCAPICRKSCCPPPMRGPKSPRCWAKPATG